MAFKQFKNMTDANKDVTTVAPIGKNRSRRTFNLINRNSLTTALVLGAFAAILTGKFLTAPKEDESEQWMDESDSESRL